MTDSELLRLCELRGTVRGFLTIADSNIAACCAQTPRAGDDVEYDYNSGMLHGFGIMEIACDRIIAEINIIIAEANREKDRTTEID